MTRISGTLHEDQYTFLIVSVSVLLGMRNVSYKFSGKIKTHVLCSVIFFRKSCRLLDNVEKQVTDEDIIRRVLCIQDN